mmetsp:Transcript_39341/g.121422  ORF Transcript_39341/g.121422 Transcript_39341/m.121422 type:complete len:246 (+) Transcript_39341:329-1066(+)
MRRRLHQLSTAARRARDFSRSRACQEARRSWISSWPLAARLRRCISLVSPSFLAAAPATDCMSAWKASSHERSTPATISSRPCSCATSARAERNPAWKPAAAAEPPPSRQAASTALAAAPLQDTASRSASCALRASRSASSSSRPTLWSASCTSSRGGLRATTASMGTQRRCATEPPAELQSTLEGLPRQDKDCTGRRSALPRSRSNASKRPIACAETASRLSSQASFSSRMLQPGMNCSSSTAS